MWFNWQTSWNNSVGNKLYDIKPKTGSSKSVVHVCHIIKEQVVLRRLRIAHSHFLNPEEQPQCVECDKHFTAHHILLECVDFSHVRNKYYHVNTIKQIFNNVPIDNIFYSFTKINYILSCVTAYHQLLQFRRRTIMYIHLISPL